MIRTRAMIPDRITSTAEWETIEPGDAWLCGRPLTRRMTEYLEVSLRGLTVEERLAQMAEINPPVYRTYQAWRRGKRPPELAIDTGISESQIRRRLARARDFMGDVEEPVTPEESIRWLEIHDPEGHRVWVLSGYGWPRERIASALGISERTVTRAAARARARVGRLDRGTMGGYARREIAVA